uniref:Uncharacterized protein n=1 Tax=viral metagenome TaxID=1070528 RepID=A0A6C0KJR8_9ZZZZ
MDFPVCAIGILTQQLRTVCLRKIGSKMSCKNIIMYFEKN